MRPRPVPQVPEQTALVARAAFAQGTVACAAFRWTTVCSGWGCGAGNIVGGRRAPSALTEAQIHGIVTDFANGAKRAIEAGFDGRVRFMLEVATAARVLGGDIEWPIQYVRARLERWQPHRDVV